MFAAAALLLAAFGVYGVVGYRVAQRMKEIAIRVALGAPRWRVTGVVLSDTVTYVGLGLAVGLPLALAAAAAIRSYLFGMEPSDGVTLATACAVVDHRRAAGGLCAGPPRAARRPDRRAAHRIDAQRGGRLQDVGAAFRRPNDCVRRPPRLECVRPY